MATPSKDRVLWPPIAALFDLTLHFEETFLRLLPSSVVTASAPLLVYRYFKRPVYVRQGFLLWAKLAVVTLLFAIELAHLIFRAISPDFPTETAVPAAVIDVIAVFALGAVIFFEHRHTIRGSAFVAVYLLVAIIFDIIQSRSYFRRHGLHPLGALCVASAVARTVLIGLGEVPKTTLLVDAELRQSLGGEATCGYWSRVFFVHLNSMFMIGFRKVLKVQHLAALGPEFASGLIYSQLNPYWQQKKRVSKNTLFFTSLWASRGLFLLIFVPRILYSVFSFAQPFIMLRVIDVVTKDPSETTDQERAILVCASIVAFVGQALSKTTRAHMTNRLVTRVRGGLTSMLLDKELRLSQKEASKSAALTLITTDVDGIIHGLPEIHELIVTPFELGFAIYFLSGFVGKSSFTVLVPILSSAVATYFFGKWTATRVRSWIEHIESRVSKTSKILDQLTALKIFGLGEVIEEYLQRLRELEIAASRRYRVMQAAANVPVLAADLLTPVVVIAAALFWKSFNGRLSAASVFPSLSIIMLVKDPLTVLLGVYPAMTAMLACCQRCQEFLQLKNRDDPRKIRHKKDEGSAEKLAPESSHPAIQLASASLAPPDSQSAVLRDVNFSLLPGSVNGVTGPNGSGKSLLLQSVLGEAEIVEGEVVLNDDHVGYCGQIPWLCNTSVKNNVIGPRPYNEGLFNKVIRCCLLEEDLQQLPGGVDYVIGTGGMRLSGGQRQRLALARTLYAQMSIVLLDNIFSSLDRKTALSILHRLIGEDGYFREGGTTVVIVSSLPEIEHLVDQMLILDGNGHITVDNNPKRDESHAKDFRTMSSEADGQLNDEDDKDKSSPDSRKPAVEEAENINMSRARSLRLYKLFFGTIGYIRTVLWCMSMFVVSAGELAPEIYMRVWIDTHPEENLYFIGYASIAAMTCILFAIVFAWLCTRLTPRAALLLHRNLAATVLVATIAFISTTDKGALLNRFSQDMSIIARILPVAFMRTIYIFWSALLQAGIVASGAWYMGIVIPFIVFSVYMVQKFYIRTSRQLRVLDLESKTPLYTHVEETAAGLLCIRGLGWQESNFEFALGLLDESQKPFYYTLAIQQWLALVLGLLVAVVAIILIAFAVFLSRSTSGTAIGLSLLNVIAFGMTLERFIQAWSALQVSVGALERLQDLMEQTPRESTQDSKQLPPNWPSMGQIELSNMSARYSDDKQEQPALNDISLSIKAGQKVGVIGRTGSGKSSLFLSLLGFLRYDGAMKIDGVDVASIAPNELRSRIITISQDQIRLEASIRVNLLPFTLNNPPEDAQSEEVKKKDSEIQQLLERLGLWSQLSDKGGLSTMLSDAAYSHGEMQLLCVARAVLRYQDTGSKVLLMDEATGSVTPEREQIAQQIMREYFAACTIIVIGHQKSNLRDVECTVELASGRIVGVHLKQVELGEKEQGNTK